jgi:hypothetical protein
MVGCGEESSSTIKNASFNIKTSKSELNDLKNKLTLKILLKNNYPTNVTTTLDNLVINVTPCTIKSTTFEPNKISFSSTKSEQEIDVFITFEKECIPTNYTLNAKSLLRLDGKSNEVAFASSLQDLSTELSAVDSVTDTNTSTDTNIDSNTSTDTDIAINYEFYNLPKEIIIEEANKEYFFRIQLLTEDKRVVSGKSISVSAYDTIFGELTSYRSVTDANGFASFSFISANSLKDLLVPKRVKTSVLKTDRFISLY